MTFLPVSSIISHMVDNEATELFSYLTKESSVSGDHLRDLLQRLFKGEEIPKAPTQPLTRESLVNTYKAAMQEDNVEERLFHLFYHLD